MGIKRKKGSVLEEDMYEVNFIKARRLVKGQPEYLIKWKGFDDDKYDTWEGLANLSGLEPDLATFEAQQKKDKEEKREKKSREKLIVVSLHSLSYFILFCFFYSIFLFPSQLSNASWFLSFL